MRQPSLSIQDFYDFIMVFIGFLSSQQLYQACQSRLSNHTRLLVVELPAWDQVLHTNSIVTSTLAIALVHVQLMSLHDL